MNAPTPGRSRLLRDLVVLQIKLMADALRDIVVSPIALVAGLFGLVIGRPPATDLFYGVVRFGRRTEQWIDPFSAGGDPKDEAGLYDVLDRIHGQLMTEYERGGVSAAAKRAIDEAAQVLSGRRVEPDRGDGVDREDRDGPTRDA
jgi:hypothetical protein